MEGLILLAAGDLSRAKASQDRVITAGESLVREDQCADSCSGTREGRAARWESLHRISGTEVETV